MPAQNLTQFPNYFTQFVGRDGRISDPWYRSLNLFRTQVADGFTLLPGPGIAVDDTQVSVGDVVTISNTGVISLVGTPDSIDIVNLSLTEQDLQASISTTYPGQTSITTLGTITTVGGISSPPFIQFDTTATEASAAGKMTWDDSSGTISVGLKGGNVTLQLGQEVVMLGYNRTGSTIANGQVVYVLGAHADDLEVGLADNSSFGTSVGTIGVATEDIPNNDQAFFTAFGLVHDLNTAAFAEGDQLWLGTSGGLTNTQPSAPANVVLVGYCVRSHPNQGIIFVKPVVRPKVSDAPDVDVTGLANGQALTWNSSTNLWQPHTLVTGTVTSVAMTVPAFLTVSGSPITSSGTLAVSYSGTPVPVVNGGTGTTTSTGTGSVVLSTSPTLTTPNITGDIQLNNTAYVRSKIAAGTSTRILGINAADNLYIGSIDAAISNFLFNNNGTTVATLNSTGFGINVVPSVKLHVAATGSATTTQFRLSNSVDSGYAQVQYVGSTFATSSRKNALELINSSTTGSIDLWTNSTIKAKLDSSGNFVLPKTAGVGIKIDSVGTPTFGWNDILGGIIIQGTGPNDPSWATFIGGIKAWQFSVNDECWLKFHIPHDYVPESDLYIHFHWAHAATTVTGGTLTWSSEATAAKGHQQGASSAFAATKTTSVTQTCTPTTQYEHFIAENVITSAGGSATLIDSALIEPDTLVLVRIWLSANALTVSAGAKPDPFLLKCDLHYQSTGVVTKNKSPSFYA